MKHLMILITILLCSQTGLVEAESLKVEKVKRVEKVEVVEKQRYPFEEGFDNCIEFIASHEGCRLYPYSNKKKIVTDRTTIGFGHVILPKDSIKWGDTITIERAHSLLRNDFTKAIKIAKRISPILEDNKLLAVGCFIFAKGSGSYQRSEFRRLVDKQASVDNALVSWPWYSVKQRHKNGEVKRTYNHRMHYNRKWELSLYNNNEFNKYKL